MKTLPILLFVLAGLGACTSSGARSSEPAASGGRLTVIPLQYAVAGEVAHALNSLRTESRVFADQRTNSVIVAYSDEAALKEVSDCIAKLDVPVGTAK